jgi:hypothetical protein
LNARPNFKQALRFLKGSVTRLSSRTDWDSTVG